MAARFDWAVPTILGNGDEPVLATDVATKAYVDAAAGSGNSISNGNSTVAIATVDGNVTITANSAHSWVFDDSGNLTLPATGELVVTSGIIGSGASPAPYLSGFDSVSAISVTATGNIAAGNISTGGALSVTGNATVGNLNTAGALTATGNATAGNLVTGGRVVATGNVSGANFAATGNLSVTGNIAIAGPGNLDIPGGTTGDVLSTDGAGNLSWLNVGAVTKLTGGAQNVGANATTTVSWTAVQNDIGLELSTVVGTPNALITYTGTGTAVLAFTWRVVWNSPTTQTGARRAYIRENSNNKDVLVAGPIAGIPAIIQSTTTILTLSNTSGGVDIGVENYGSDSCIIGGATTPTGDYYLAPSNECIIVLLGKY